MKDSKGCEKSMTFESFVNNIEGARYQVSGKMVALKFIKGSYQEIIDVRYLSESISAVRSGGS